MLARRLSACPAQAGASPECLFRENRTPPNFKTGSNWLCAEIGKMLGSMINNPGPFLTFHPILFSKQALNKGNEQKLGDWGFKVDTSARSSGEPPPSPPQA